VNDAVRPTQRCLDDLSYPIPDLGVPLSSIAHPLVVKAQRVPDLVVSGAGEHIRSLTDRHWLEVKTGIWRGAVTRLQAELSERIVQFEPWWWLATGGMRQDDSSQKDFYSQLTEAAHRSGPHSCSTDYLLPSVWDERRLIAEAGVNAQLVVEHLVRTAAAESLLNSDIRGFVVGDRDVRVRIHVHEDGQAYVAIGATGSLDATFFVTLVSSIPGVPVGDWLPEPEGDLGITPEPGEVIWSAMLSAEAQAELIAGVSSS
jgi:hypothetical protein